VIGSADDDRSAGAAPQQPNATQDQGPHDPFTEFGFLDKQIAQPALRNQQDFDRLPRHPVTSAGRPDSWASSPMNDPGPWLTL
jgi:hypothetical protein